MSITLEISDCSPKLIREVWQIWRTIPSELTCKAVDAKLGYLEYGKDDDEVMWQKQEFEVLEKLRTDSAISTAVIYGKDNIDDLNKIRKQLTSELSKYSIKWKNKIPFPTRQIIVPLQTSGSIHELVISTAWSEDQGTYVMFNKESDLNIVSRFKKQKWNDTDQFIAIAVYGHSPSWIVISNYLSSSDLNSKLEGWFSSLKME